jgi:hypothetical protein
MTIFPRAAAIFFAATLVSAAAMAAAPEPAAPDAKPAAESTATAPVGATPVPRPVVRKAVRRLKHRQVGRIHRRRVRMAARPAPAKRCLVFFCEGPILLIGAAFGF